MKYVFLFFAFLLLEYFGWELECFLMFLPEIMPQK